MAGQAGWRQNPPPAGILIGIFGIDRAINYIEGNQVRANFAAVPEKWTWSSAYAGTARRGVVPDNANMPILMT